MKISNSKKQLAEIIHENGGWCDGAEWAAQDRIVAFFSGGKPAYDKVDRIWCSNGDNGNYIASIEGANRVANWHQTILSRDEYFHVYHVAEPAPAQIWINPPTIEQLAADYRNAKGYADRKQREADAAKADADDKLAELVAAGKALGLVLSVAGVEPELVITDWRDLRVGDIIEYVDGRNKNRVGMVGRVDRFDLYNTDTDRPVRMVSDDGQVGWPTKWRFISRP